MTMKQILKVIFPVFLFIANTAFAHHGGPHGEINFTLLFLLVTVGALMVCILVTRLRKVYLTYSIDKKRGYHEWIKRETNI